MKTEILKDRNGRKIGDIITDPSGKLIIRDSNGRRLGDYIPKDNVTRDANGHRIGFGNLLTTLL